MNNLYELFKVDENASQKEITDSYNRIIENANSLPQTEKLIEQIQRIKIAYGILSDEEKRKKYDLDLATKRAETLLETVKPKEIEEAKEEQVSIEQEINKQLPEKDNNQINKEKLRSEISKTIDEQVNEMNRQKQAEKERKKQERKAKKLAKKELEYEREKEMYEYGRYLENQGYKVKYPWTWLRIKRLLISLLTVFITCVILWHIPFVRKQLVALYEENFVIKFFVDIILNIFSSKKNA